MPRLTPDQLIDALLALPGGAIEATLVTRTRPTLLQKSRATQEPCPFMEGIERLATRRVTLGADYEAEVDRQRKSEQGLAAAKFTPEPLWHGLGVWETPLTVRHATTGRRYLAFRPDQRDASTAAGSIAVVLEDQWRDIATGRVLDYRADRLAEYLSRGANGEAVAKSQTQRVRHDVQWRTVALDAIVEVRCGGVVYEVVA